MLGSFIDPDRKPRNLDVIDSWGAGRRALTGKEDPVVRAGAFFSALFMLTLPFSTAVSIATTGLVFLCWMLSCQFRRLPVLLSTNPVAAGASLVYGFLLIGTLYGDTARNDSFSLVWKYREFALLLILMPFMQQEKYRRWVVTAFIIASIMTLLGSYLKDFGVLPLSRQGTPTFKSRITHNLFMAVFGYVCLYRASIASDRRWLWFILFLLTAYNLFVVVQGRTGQIIFVLLIVLFCFQRFQFKRALVLAPLVLLGFFAMLAVPGSGGRFGEGIEESKDYLQGHGNLATSMGQRLYFWQNSIDLISGSPIVGYGTGSFAKEFSRISQATDLTSKNPHNEYLMIAVQVGGIGLLAYLLFLGALWRFSFDLGQDRRWFAQGVFLSLSVNSLFNTTFLDHTEGHWFAALIAMSFSSLRLNHWQLISRSSRDAE